MLRFTVRRLIEHGVRAVRGLGADVPDLHGHAGRRGRAGGASDRRPQRQRGPGEHGQARNGASTSRSTCSTCDLMKKVFTGELISYTNQVNVREEIVRGIPRTASLVIGAGLIWLFFGVLFGVLSAVYAGRFTDRALNVLALIGISLPVFWVGLVLLYYLTYRIAAVPARRVYGAWRRPGRLGLPPDPALVRAVDPVHRVLQPRAQVEHPRHLERGLRANSQGKGAQSSGASCSATRCAMR